MTQDWKTEATCLSAIALLALVTGMVISNIALALAAGALVFLGWHFYQLIRLFLRLSRRQRLQPPFPGGLWNSIYEHIRRLQTAAHERKRRLSLLYSRFRAAAAALPDAVIILREQGEIEWCNPAARTLLGLPWPGSADRPLTTLIRQPVLAEYLNRVAPSRPLEFPSPVDKTRMLSLHVTAFGHNRQRLVVVRDITRIYSLDQMRRDFVANVSHELRTPLTVISGFLEAMEDGLDDDSWAQPVCMMHEQAKRMQAIIDDLLTLSRLEMNEPPPQEQAIAVADLLRGIMAEARQLSGEADHRFFIETSEDLGLLGNKTEIRAAFSNLVFNAVRHTPGGSEIRINWRPNADGAEFSVSDTGEGIAARHIPRLTERFYRVDSGRSRESGGTGLGLAIVKHVLSRHDSELQIASKPGKGSTFSCRFPAVRTVSLKTKLPFESIEES